MRVVCTGAGGFIGGHLVRALLDRGDDVRAIDCKPRREWEQLHADAETIGACDLRVDGTDAITVLPAFDVVFALAADMGGMGYLTYHEADVLTANLLTSVNTIDAAVRAGIPKVVYASSACVYPEYRQETPDVIPLAEDMAYPAAPDLAYGWEKLTTERLLAAYHAEGRLDVRIARLHNIYGPCYDEAVEVLTTGGWRKFADLSDSDTIASLDPESGIVEYLVPVAYQRYHYDGPMYRVESSRGIDLAVTPDHSLYVGTRTNSRGRYWRLEQAKNLRWDMARMWFTSHGTWLGGAVEPITLPATLRVPERLIDPKLWFEFAGWFLSEGSAWKTPTNYTVTITQNAGQKQDAIRACVSGMGFSNHTANGKNVIICSKQLWQAVEQFGKGAANKLIPRWMLDAERPLLQALFDALMAGDGDEDGRRYSTTSRQLADDVQELALKLGLRAWISCEPRRRDRHSDIYRVHVSPLQSTDTRRDSRWIEHYQGYVYDVTLPRNHILMVRRNGKPCWSGNCGTWDGGREKAPAALCRKAALAPDGGEIEVWGDGQQTRSFCYITDCVTGLLALAESDYTKPVNIGSDRLVTIDDLAGMAIGASGKDLTIRHVAGPQGVRGRNADLSLCRKVLGWEPQVSLEDGMNRTYEWVAAQAAAAGRVA